MDEKSKVNASAFEQEEGQDASVQTSEYVEPNNVFAEGLPDWSIEPPQVMVRRH